jgi:hypothetical protein
MFSSICFRVGIYFKNIKLKTTLNIVIKFTSSFIGKIKFILAHNEQMTRESRGIIE